MAQVLKAEVRDRIASAALHRFAAKGVSATTMSEIAEQAGVAVANLYRYYPSKDALFEAVVPHELVRRFDALLEASARSHAFVTRGETQTDATDATALLDFWIEHRLAVVILLERCDGTVHERFAQRFVDRLASVSIAEIRENHRGITVHRDARLVLENVFTNTRRMIAAILRESRTDDEARRAVSAFRSYQVAGLEALVRWIVASQRAPTASE